MPEGPEVYKYAAIAKKFVGKFISIEPLQKEGVILKRFIQIFLKRKIKSVETKGKVLAILFENGDGLVFRFGLTGRFVAKNLSNVEELPKYTQFFGKILDYETHESSTYLCFTDPRKFGSVIYFKNGQKIKELFDSLGPDLRTIGYKVLHERILSFSKRRMKLTTLLMSQTLLVSGIGNYLTSEIMYDAKIFPSKKMNELSEKEIDALCKSMIDVYKRMLTDKYFEVYHKKFDSLGNKVVSSKGIISGRTLWWVPEIQQEK
jgi:formamidopyrimidine-DNA glycosylase